MTALPDPAHQHWDELAAGYALDALEPAEEAELLGHLVGCATCREGLRDHEFVAAQLAALAEDAELAPPSWSSIRGGIVDSPPPPIRLDEHAARRRRQPRLLAAAAAAVVLAAGGVVAWQLSTGGTTSSAEAIRSCRAQTSCHVIGLQSGHQEQAVVLVRDGKARLLTTGLSAPTGGHVYALWQLPRQGGRPTLLAEPVGTGTSSSALVLPYDDTAAFALSVEPAGSVATSPTTVIAVGSAT